MFGGKARNEIYSVALSNDTVQRRITSMAQNVEDQLVTCLRQSQFFSLQLDKSTDIGNEENLLCFVRCSYAGRVHDEFFFVIPCQPTPHKKQFLTHSVISLCRITSTGQDMLNSSYSCIILMNCMTDVHMISNGLQNWHTWLMFSTLSTL